MKDAETGFVWSAPHDLNIVTVLSRFPFTSADQAQASKLLDEGYDEDIIFDLLQFHRLSVHGARNLNILTKKDLPQSFRLELARRAVYAEQYTQQQVSELGVILEAFAKAHIPIMPIKGPAVAARLYDDPLRRVLHDIDVMVRPEDTRRAVNLLESLGYKQPKTVLKSDAADKDIKRLQAWGSNIGFMAPDRPVLIELHWRPGRYHHEFPFSPGELWDAAVPLTIGEITTQSLSPVHEALFLCAHGCKHEWKRLHWLLDIAAITRNPDFNWDDAMGLARERGLEKVTALSVFLAHRVFQVPMPEIVSNVVDDHPALKARAEGILNRRYSNSPKNDNALDEAKMEWRTSGLQSGFFGRLRTVLSHLRPGPDDWNWIKLPSAFSPLYYPIRMVRIFVELLKSVIGR